MKSWQKKILQIWFSQISFLHRGTDWRERGYSYWAQTFQAKVCEVSPPGTTLPAKATAHRAWGYISKKENLVSTCLYENHRFTSWFAVCWNTCCISKDSFLLRLQSEPRQGSSSWAEQCKLASHPPPSCPAPCTPGNTSDGFASRTPCCHTPEANTNSLNAKYSLLLGSDNLNSSLWKQRNPKQLFLCANLQSSCMGTTPPNFFQNTCKIKIWRERIVIHLPTSVNPFTVWCGTSLWSEIKTLTI